MKSFVLNFMVFVVATVVSCVQVQAQSYNSLLVDVENNRDYADTQRDEAIDEKNSATSWKNSVHAKFTTVMALLPYGYNTLSLEVLLAQADADYATAEGHFSSGESSNDSGELHYQVFLTHPSDWKTQGNTAIDRFIDAYGSFVVATMYYSSAIGKYAELDAALTVLLNIYGP